MSEITFGDHSTDVQSVTVPDKFVDSGIPDPQQQQQQQQQQQPQQQPQPPAPNTQLQAPPANPQSDPHQLTTDGPGEAPISIEDKAREMNWAPFEEWRAKAPAHLPDSAWVDAQTFVDREPHGKMTRGNLLDRSVELDKRTQELDDIRREMRGLSKMAAQNFIAGQKAERAKLEAAHNAAVVSENPQEALNIADQIREVDQAIQDAGTQVNPSADQVVFKQQESQWLQDNDSLMQRPEFAALYKETVSKFVQTDQEGNILDPHNHYRNMEAASQETLKSLPHLQTVNPNRNAPPATAAAATATVPQTTTSSPTPSFDALPAEIKEQFAMFEKHGAFKGMDINKAKQEYVQELINDGALS